jgi:predicted transcriptional regulator
MSDDNSNDNNSIKMRQQQSPTRLSGLRQAIYIMRCLDNGEYFEQIVQKFDGDEQLVKLWMSFLLHNKCIQNPAIDHKWLITEKGKRWIEKYDERHGNDSKTTPMAN